MIQLFEFLVDIFRYYFIYQISLMILLGKDHEVKNSKILVLSLLPSIAYQVSGEILVLKFQLLVLGQLISLGLHFLILLYLTKKIWLKPLGIMTYITILSTPVYFVLAIISFSINIENYVPLGFLASITLTLYAYLLRNLLNSDHYEKFFYQVLRIFHKFTWLFIIIAFGQTASHFISTFRPGSYTEIVVWVSNFLYIMSAILVLILIYFIKKLIFDQQHLQEQIQSLSENTNTINHLYKGMKRYQGDVSKVIRSISPYVEDDDYDTLSRKFHLNTSSLKDIDLVGFEPLLQLKNLHISSLKGLIFNKYHQAEKSNVLLQMGIIDTLHDLSVNDIDLCRMVGILIDNAIEAAEQSVEKKVNLIFDRKKHDQKEQWQIQITNSYNGQNISMDLSGKWKSSKGPGRGLGLKSLKVILRKYNHVSWSSMLEKDLVTQTLIFNI